MGTGLKTLAGIATVVTAVWAAGSARAASPAPEKAVRGRLCHRAEAHPRPKGAPKCSDVSMRLFRAHKNNREIEVGKAFHITRGDWSYLYGVKDKAAYVRKVKALGWTFQGATNAVTRNPDHAIKLRNGKPMLDHFQKKGRYWADMNNEDYRKWYVEQLEKWVELGADSIQRDEPTTCNRTPLRTAVAFFKDVHARFEKAVGRKVSLSCNMRMGFAFGGREPVNRLFDFGMAEFYRKDLKPALMVEAARDAERRGKALVYTGGGPMTKSEIRCAIAGSYANGINYIVPWDQFTGVKCPRLFGKPEDYADLYGFVRAAAKHLEGYEAAVASIPVPLLDRQLRQSLANDLFAGGAFTVVMVTRSRDGAFGIGGNAPHGGGGIPRLYMTRSGFSYGALAAARAGTRAGAVEITTFTHDGRNRVTVHRNGSKAGTLAGSGQAVKGSFGSGGHLSIPHNAGDRNHSGDVAELIAFRGRLPADRLEALHAALAKKYLAGHAGGKADLPGKLLGAECTLHLCASDLAGSHKAGKPVAKWRARTGQYAIVPRARLASGKTAGAPTFVPGAINGHAVVRFDGVDDLVRIVSTTSRGEGAPFAVVSGTGSGRLCIFGRAKPGDENAAVVLHLVEWLGRPKPATVELRPEAFFGDRKLRVVLLKPAAYDAEAHAKAEKSKDYFPLAERVELKTTRTDGRVRVSVPALRPWGLLVVSPAE